MSYKIGDRVRIIDKNLSKPLVGQIGTIIDIETDVFLRVFYIVKLDDKSFCNFYFDEKTISTLELLYPLQQLSIDVLKEDDHAGQIYNPYNDTWSWL